VALVAAPTVQAQDGPGGDQYIPSEPTATGKKDTRDRDKNTPAQPSGGSSDDQVLDQIAGGGSGDAGKKKASKKDKPAKKREKQDSEQTDTTAVAPAATGGDDDDDDGALASVGSAITDWDDPIVPGLVTLVALITLIASVTVLVRRRNAS
jgi:hypothetical protein